MYQVTKEFIRIGGVFLLQKMPINSTAPDLNAETRQGPIVYAPQECGYAEILNFRMF